MGVEHFSYREQRLFPLHCSKGMSPPHLVDGCGEVGLAASAMNTQYNLADDVGLPQWSIKVNFSLLVPSKQEKTDRGEV